MFGVDFLPTFRCGISFAKEKLFVGRNQVALIKKNGIDWCRRVQVADCIEIPALAQIYVPSKAL